MDWPKFFPRLLHISMTFRITSFSQQQSLSRFVGLSTCTNLQIVLNEMVMSKEATTARGDYLDKASRTLISSSPAISAHLQSVRRKVVENADGETLSGPRNETCGACGYMLIPGWSCKFITKGINIDRTRKDRINKESGDEKTLKLQCSKCNVLTTRKATRPIARHKSYSASSQFPSSVPTNVKATTINPSAETSSEDTAQPSRKRTRGKNSTLQSMLANSKIATPTRSKGFGLDLKDLMKT